jgi:hypothetical protein
MAMTGPQRLRLFFFSYCPIPVQVQVKVVWRKGWRRRITMSLSLSPRAAPYG